MKERETEREKERDRARERERQSERKRERERSECLPRTTSSWKGGVRKTMTSGRDASGRKGLRHKNIS